MNLPPYCQKSTLVLGCGNILLGDDGFGPAVANYLLKDCKIHEDVCVMDVGTGVREILFNITLSEKKPKKIIIVDSVNARRSPGEIFEIQIDDIPHKKIGDFSMHQLPTSNLLRELKDLCGVGITIIAAQIAGKPDIVEIKLSDPIAKAVPTASKLIVERYINKS